MIRAQLQAIGIDDLPRNGVFLLAGIDSAAQAHPDLASGIGVTKQAVSQLIDTLVSRGYLRRSPDADDRRRISAELTERGRQALEAAGGAPRRSIRTSRTRPVRAGRGDANRPCRSCAEIKRGDIETGAACPGPHASSTSSARSSPCATSKPHFKHYSSLGFRTIAYPASESYGFANRDGVGIHLCVVSEEDDDHGHHHASAYLYVRDADALYAEWSQPGIGGSTHLVQATDYKLREGAHFDPDGNLIRFGSPMET